MMGGNKAQQQVQQPQTNNIDTNGQQQQGNGESEAQTPAAPLFCIRHGCQNPAITNPEWEDEYCSNECVVTHC
ncbi:TOX high mobility group box member 3, partial [Homalodisca vitripennis]